MDLDVLRPVASGLVGAFVVYLLARSGRKSAPQHQGKRVLSYSTTFKVVAALFVPGSIFVAYAAAHARPSQTLVAGIVAAAFVLSAAFLVYQAFFVHIAYDDTNLYYRSPLAGSNVVPWSAVTEVAYSGLMQSHYLRTTVVPQIWCSNMLLGYEELGAFLASKLGDHEGEA